MTIRHLDSLLRPQAVICVGLSQEPAVRQMLDNLRAQPQLPLVQTDARLTGWPSGGANRSCALIAEPALADVALIARLGERGCRALLWPLATAPGAELLAETRRQGMRLLGPRCGGVIQPAVHLNAASFPCAPGEGGLALIAQSQSIAAAALDWATGRHLGFSWVAISGAEADVDVADLLDYAALDPHTRGVVLQLSHLRGGRKFMSAARACARLKPVVVLQTQPAARIGRGPDPVRSTAFARAGLVECESLPGLFDALAALQRLPALQSAQALVVGNGAGICTLGVDALARQGLEPLALSEERRAELPRHRQSGGALDFGNAPAAVLADAMQRLLADPKLPSLLLIHSPATGSSHSELAELISQHPDPRLLTVWLGLDSVMPARNLCAQAGLATFTSADAAARALRYRWEYHRRRELLTQTPPPQRLPDADPAALRAQLRERAATGPAAMSTSELGQLLAAYGLPAAQPGAGGQLDVAIVCHPELGQHLRASRPGGSPAYGFAPLDGLLAGRLLDRAGLAADDPARAPLSAALVQLAQLLVDQPALLSLELRLAVEGSGSAWLTQAASATLTAAPASDRQRLVLAPWPSELSGLIEASDGRRYRVRAVRPADEPALIRLLQKLDAEEVRMRFFTYIRHFSHAMGARMTQIDYDREMSLVLVPEGGDPDEVMAIATLVADPDGRHAEFGLLVHHDHAQCGLGRALLQRLLDHAWQRGIGQVYGVVLSENTPMLKAAQKLGFRRRPEPEEPGCLRVEINAPA